MTWIKICGIAREEDAAAAVAAGADAIGFVFYPPSPRAVSPEVAAAIAAALPRWIARVGVFVGESVAAMAAIRARVGLDVLQLHGDDDPAAVRSLRCRLIRAIRRPEDAVIVAAYPGEIVLVDGERAGLHGGTGMPAAPAAIAAARRNKRWILSGGLTPETVAAKVATFAPWGVDVSSGVERAPGIKDPDRIAAFVAAVRASDSRPGTAADRNGAHSLGNGRSAA